ncbi:hypothetical protein EV193_102198 [Herbihabitans rhizosphaerae]|uniref:3-methyladenine DNA glycosylase n=1 Tax=Herbihabitans rhizosphaerae TaxID=1872711 RepID=A0A4Q7L155_9PSEU|nr:hypothetical protein EV193_102198 [Herbihabitans rhizosphaerae]
MLGEAAWTARRDEHVARVRRWTEPHARRRAAGEKHPVLDFMFTYYSFRPSKLLRWHPGPGVVLAGSSAREYLRWPAYAEVPGGVALDLVALPDNRRETASFVLDLLRATAARTPRLNCFGLHEWAMVYRAGEEEIRHTGWPLRLGRGGTNEVVESSKLRCTHYDAFRFFTAPARPRNTVQPSRPRQIELEQPGCLHATMDLYKWAYKLDPYAPSDLLADCFELALEVRALDMRASPYDLSAIGFEPVPIESERGRAQYVREQAALTERAAPLRERLTAVCAAVLTSTSAQHESHS